MKELSREVLKDIWDNIDLRRPDEVDIYDHHDHCVEASWRYIIDFCDGTPQAEVVVDGCSCDPAHGPEDINYAEYIGYKTYDLTEFTKAR